MSERDELAELLSSDRLYYDTGSHYELSADDAADAIIAAGYRKPRTITTAEELDDLPLDVVIRTQSGRVYEKGVFEDEEDLPFWTLIGEQRMFSARSIPLPATVLWEPK